MEVTKKQAAEMLGVSQREVVRRIERGDLKARKKTDSKFSDWIITIDEKAPQKLKKKIEKEINNHPKPAQKAIEVEFGDEEEEQVMDEITEIEPLTEPEEDEEQAPEVEVDKSEDEEEEVEEEQVEEEERDKVSFITSNPPPPRPEKVKRAIKIQQKEEKSDEREAHKEDKELKWWF